MSPNVEDSCDLFLWLLLRLCETLLQDTSNLVAESDFGEPLRYTAENESCTSESRTRNSGGNSSDSYIIHPSQQTWIECLLRASHFKVLELPQWIKQNQTNIPAS